MKDISLFADVVGNPSTIGSLDPQGSTVDMIFAEAIIANEPTTVLEEAGIIRVKTVPAEVDKVEFPIVLNKQLTWKTISRGTPGTSNDAGSEFGVDFPATSLNAVTYKIAQPVWKTANIFLPDTVSLMNATDFNLFTQIAATDAKRKKEADGLATLMGSQGDTNAAGPLTLQGTSNAYTIKVAGGYSAFGSVGAGSLITPLDIVKAKRDLSTGSDPWFPDFILMHPTQYAQLNTHPDFAPGATNNGAMMRKAQFDDSGDLVRFAGLDIYVSELVPALTGAANQAIGTGITARCVLVGTKGLALGRGEHEGIKVSTEDSRRRHGQWKIFDMDYDNVILVKQSMIGLIAADN